MTGPSSGDRPAEDLMGALRDSLRAARDRAEALPPRARPTVTRPATPPAVRTGDEASVERPIGGHLSTCRRFYENRPGEDACRCTPPPVSGTATRDDVREYEPRAESGTWRCLACRAEGDGSATVTDRAKHTAWHAALRAALPTPPPVSGTATRDDVRERYARWLSADRIGDDGAWWDTTDREDRREEFRAKADELLALGGSQPAAQPVQPAEEQRPIDLLTEQGDEGWVATPATVEVMVEAAELSIQHGLPVDFPEFVAGLRRALDDGGAK